jgi:hypothetical protein
VRRQQPGGAARATRSASCASRESFTAALGSQHTPNSTNDRIMPSCCGLGRGPPPLVFLVRRGGNTGHL